MKKRIIFVIILVAFALLSYNIVQAQGIIPDATGDPCANSSDPSECGNYELNDMVQLIANAAGLILSLVGSIALLMFIYGGVLMMASGGESAEAVARGKKVITAAIVGMIIVFSSYLIIKFVLGSLGIEWEGRIQKFTAISGQEYNV